MKRLILRPDKNAAAGAMLTTLERITTAVRDSNPYWEYRFDTYRQPSGGTGEYYYVHTPGSVMVIPRIGNNSFVLLRQYRYLNHRESIEFPGGGIKPDTLVEWNARKELQEEAGYTTDALYMLGQFNPCNGVTDELCSVFLADSLSTTYTEPDDSEEFEPVILSAREIADAIRRGEIWDGMTMSAWSLFLVSDYFLQH